MSLIVMHSTVIYIFTTNVSEVYSDGIHDAGHVEKSIPSSPAQIPADKLKQMPSMLRHIPIRPGMTRLHSRPSGRNRGVTKGNSDCILIGGVPTVIFGRLYKEVPRRIDLKTGSTCLFT